MKSSLRKEYEQDGLKYQNGDVRICKRCYSSRLIQSSNTVPTVIQEVLLSVTPEQLDFNVPRSYYPVQTWQAS